MHGKSLSSRPDTLEATIACPISIDSSPKLEKVVGHHHGQTPCSLANILHGRQQNPTVEHP